MELHPVVLEESLDLDAKLVLLVDHIVVEAEERNTSVEVPMVVGVEEHSKLLVFVEPHKFVEVVEELDKLVGIVVEEPYKLAGE
jgi:hypothetical protein